MIELSISEVLDKAWELTKKHGIMLAVIFFVFYVVYYVFSFAITFAFSSVDPESGDGLVGTLACMPFLWIIAIVFSAGFMRMMLLIAKEELPSVSLDAYKMEAMTYVKYFAVSFCYSFAVILGFVCLVFPGVFLLARLCFAPLYILDNPGASIGEAFSASWKMTEGNVLMLIALGIVAYLISMIGVLACCIGVLYTCVISMFCFVVAYLTLRESLLNE